MPNTEETNDGHVVQALEATHIVESLLSNHVLTQPLILADDELQAAAEKAAEALAELYQLIGAKI